MLTDARGCPTSTPSSVSLQQYEQALELSAELRARSAGDDPDGAGRGSDLRDGSLPACGAGDHGNRPRGVALLTRERRGHRGAGTPRQRSRACPCRGGAHAGCRATSPARSSATATSCSIIRTTCWRCRSRTSATSSSAPPRCCATGSRRCCRRGIRARRATATCSACTRSVWRRLRCIRAPKTSAGARSTSIGATRGRSTPLRT